MLPSRRRGAVLYCRGIMPGLFPQSDPLAYLPLPSILHHLLSGQKSPLPLFSTTDKVSKTHRYSGISHSLIHHALIHQGHPLLPRMPASIPSSPASPRRARLPRSLPHLVELAGIQPLPLRHQVPESLSSSANPGSFSTFAWVCGPLRSWRFPTSRAEL